MERRLAEYEARSQEPEVDWEQMLRNDPLGALEEAGLGYDKLTELALNDGKLTPDMQIAAMREEIERDYKRKFEDLEERLQAKEEESTAISETIAEYVSHVKSVHDMEMFYGEPVIQDLINRTKVVLEETERFRDTFEYTLDYELEEELNDIAEAAEEEAQ